MQDQEVMVKATPLNAVLHFMEEKLEPPVRERILDEVAGEFPDAARKAREKSILAFDRVPLKFANRLLEATAAELRQPAAVVAHAVGRKGAEEAAKGVLRLALTMISMQGLLRKLEPVWSQLYTHGRMTSECRDGSATIELHDFPMISATHCARVTGWFEWFAEKAERTARVRHSSCRASGNPACRWEVTW